MINWILYIYCNLVFNDEIKCLMWKKCTGMDNFFDQALSSMILYILNIINLFRVHFVYNNIL